MVVQASEKSFSEKILQIDLSWTHQLSLSLSLPTVFGKTDVCCAIAEIYRERWTLTRNRSLFFLSFVGSKVSDASLIGIDET